MKKVARRRADASWCKPGFAQGSKIVLACIAVVSFQDAAEVSANVQRI